MPSSALFELELSVLTVTSGICVLRLFGDWALKVMLSHKVTVPSALNSPRGFCVF